MHLHQIIRIKKGFIIVKKILKKVIIVFLTVLTVALVFAIIFYKYIPTNKVIPTKVPAYSTPESVEAEIKESNTETEFASENQVYEITDSDLSQYQSKRSYNPGKSDPFKEYTESSDDGNNGTSNAQNGSPSSSDGKTNSGGTSTENKNVTDNYYKASGIGTGSK